MPGSRLWNGVTVTTGAGLVGPADPDPSTNQHLPIYGGSPTNTLPVPQLADSAPQLASCEFCELPEFCETKKSSRFLFVFIGLAEI